MKQRHPQARQKMSRIIDEIGAALRALVGYGVAIAALIALMAARVHRMDLRFEGRA